MPSIVVIDGTGTTQTVQSLPPVGQATSANSLPVVLPSDQVGVKTSAQSISVVNASDDYITTSNSPFNFQQTCTTGAVALPSNTCTQGVRVAALASNTGTVYIGGSGVTTSNGFPLYPGSFYDYRVKNSNLIYIVGSDNTQVVAATGS